MSRLYICRILISSGRNSMKKYFVLHFVLITAFVNAQNTSLPKFSLQPVSPDTLTPLRVVEKYVSPEGFPEKMRHFCCEMYQEWMAPKTLGQQLDSTVIREIHLLYQDTARAVVTVWLHNEKTSMDVYFYLQHRQVWTVYAVRSLVMKDLAKDELKRLDSIPQNERGKTYTKQHGHSWQFDRDNAMLWSSPDTIIANHFHLTKARFGQLEKMRAKMYMVSPTDSIDSTYFASKKMRKAMDKLLIRAIRSDRNAPGAVLYLIGGVLDNTVGYMYQPDPRKVPQVSAGYFILIRPLGGGWYLYKTT